MPDRYGEPVTIGQCTICTGDYLLGDRDGVVIVPAAVVEEVVTRPTKGSPNTGTVE